MTISVIIPCFNATGTIIKCLKALGKQTIQPLEVVIVDDGSRDNLDFVINRFKLTSKIKKLKLIKQSHKGVSEARNLGARKARGQILAFIDSDCIPGANWLKNLTAPFSNREIGAVGGGYNSGIDDSFWQKFSNEELYFRRRGRKGYVLTLLSNNMACRKNVFWEEKGFPKKYPVCEDMYLAYQISRKHKILWLEDNGVKHHFKKNLKSYLKHQYFFGQQSTKFFLDNPDILLSNNHQGKVLHMVIGTSFLSVVGLLIAFGLVLLNYFLLAQAALVSVGVMFFVHFLLYSKFIWHLRKKGLPKINLIKAYCVSYLRDVVASFSFFSGWALYIKERKL